MLFWVITINIHQPLLYTIFLMSNVANTRVLWARRSIKPLYNGVHIFSFTVCLYVCDFRYKINILQTARPEMSSTKISLNIFYGLLLGSTLRYLC